MTIQYRKVEYYHITVPGHVNEGSQLLSAVADAGVDFLAYKAIPAGPDRSRFTLFPIDGAILAAGAKKAGWELDGPHAAVIVTGEEKPGALADIYRKLARAEIPVEESCGIAHVHGGYGIVLYLKPEDCEKAIAALEK